MSKKYTPSGYQIITIDSSRVDESYVLPKETEDEKLLYDIFKNKKFSKPILLTEVHNKISAFVTRMGDTGMFISTSNVEDGTWMSLSIQYNRIRDVITVIELEQ